MTKIPHDILQDTFLFLNRNEVEKSQLVCSSWNSIIEGHSSIMPLRLLNQLKIYTSNKVHPYALADNEIIFDTEELERVQKRAENLKFCVIKLLVFDQEHCYSLDEKSVQVRTLGIKFPAKNINHAGRQAGR